MVQFKNVNTKEFYEDYKNKFSKFKKYEKNIGNIVINFIDKWGHEYNLVSRKNSNEYFICNVCYTDNDIPFCCNFTIDDNIVTILPSEKCGRKYKSDRMLKQFTNITLVGSTVAIFEGI